MILARKVLNTKQKKQRNPKKTLDEIFSCIGEEPVLDHS